MTVNPGATGLEGSIEPTTLTPDTVGKLAKAYIETSRGPHGDAPGSDAAVTGPVARSAAGKLVSPALVAAHYQLGRHRPVGDTRVAVYGGDQPGGFGPALQIVTDHASMLMDSVTVLLHRLSVAYRAIMNPVCRVRRGPTGELLDITPASDPAAPRDGIDETWIHVQLARSVDRKALAEAERLVPHVLADARQVALDSDAMAATLSGLANELDTNPEGP